jgi:hypothetical protein
MRRLLHHFLLLTITHQMLCALHVDILNFGALMADIIYHV